MNHLILVRHGQSIWNLEKRFTGWVDVDLTQQGKLEATKSGELIKELGLKIDNFFCSYQKRSINTLEIILNSIQVKSDQITSIQIITNQHKPKHNTSNQVKSNHVT